MHLDQIPHVGVMNIGLGNIGSIISGLKRSNSQLSIIVLTSPPDLEASNALSHLILPGRYFSKGNGYFK